MDSDRVGMPDWQQPPYHITAVIKFGLETASCLPLIIAKSANDSDQLPARQDFRQNQVEANWLYLYGQDLPSSWGQDFFPNSFQFTVDFEFMHLWNMKAVAIC